MSVAELIKQVKALPAREREKLFLAILALQSLYFFRLVAFLDLVRNRSGLGGVLRWVLQCLKPCAIVGGPVDGLPRNRMCTHISCEPNWLVLS